MVRVLIILSLIFGGIVAMAKDGSVQVPKRPEQPRTSAEDYWASEEGRFLERQYQRFENGEITLEQSQDEYDKKFGGKQAPAAMNLPQLSPRAR